LRGLVTVEGTQIGLHRRGGHEGPTDGVVDDLGVDVPARAGHDETGTLGRSGETLADAQVAAAARGHLALGALDDHRHGLLTSLSNLATDVLARVADALGLVGVGLAQLADVRSHLADELLVDALDREAGR